MKAKRDKQGDLYTMVRYAGVRAFIVPQSEMINALEITSGETRLLQALPGGTLDRGRERMNK